MGEEESKMKILSLGAGVQSSTLALMAEHGVIEKPDYAIFADTQDEPASVYQWLDYLEGFLSYEVIRVTNGKLSDEALRYRNSKDGRLYTRSILPVFTLDENLNKGHMQRVCTVDFKVKLIEKTQRRLAKVKRGESNVVVTSYIVISLDEASRMKPSRVKWAENKYPLIDLRMNRLDCLTWMRKNGYKEPPRSACVFCPYHSDAEWIRLKNEEPAEFRRAVEFEKELQRTKSKTSNMRSVPYLHRSRVSLAEINFDEIDNALRAPSLFDDECEGMCGL